jgi:hypothetical protein
MNPRNKVARGWLGWIVGGLLIVIGIVNALKLTHFNLDWPSATLILVGALSLFPPLLDLIYRIHKLKYKEIEVILDDMVLSPKLRAELSGLSSHDIWALSDFAEAKITVSVDKMKPAQRVAARMLVDFKLLTITCHETERIVSLTSEGRQLLDAAKSLPL